MCAEGHRPICQDTGIVNVFLKIGMDVRWKATARRGRRQRGRAPRLQLNPDNKLRASIVADPPSAQEHQGQHAGVVHMRWCRATPST
jgi:fumarate hydratase, class I